MSNPESAYGQVIASVLSSSPAAAGSVEAAFSNVILANASTQAPPGTAIEALNKWEQASYRALGRHRNWLTHNMILFLTDYINSSKGSSDLKEVAGDFREHLVVHGIGNLSSHPAVHVAKAAGELLTAKLFLGLGLRALGGVVLFVLEVTIETVVAGLLDKTKETVAYTAEQIDGLVTGVVNPIVDHRQEELTKGIQDLRGDLAKESPSAQEWSRIRDETMAATVEVDALFPDEKDEHLYLLMALIADVYSRRSVPAEDKSPVALTGVDYDIGFTMQHTEVKTGQTWIRVLEDGGTVVVRFRAYDAVAFEGDFSPVDINGPDASPAWKTPPPPREYDVLLYQSGTVSDSTIGVPRVYHVGKEEYGVWYNLPKGEYHLTAQRGDDHIVALCAEGKYWVKTGL